MKPTAQLRLVRRWVQTPGMPKDFCHEVQVLQQRWSRMNNWAELAGEWRDVPVVDEVPAGATLHVHTGERPEVCP